ncbi:glycosyltransferase family 4 protein [Flavobacterium glaciei]|uniref:Glycosyltransferase involved in cell wall biosynthesis n=1 Tax=Flavobacterium glaciei TaxID=386300 RepID=A0A562Q7K8_9FLAO|nr:glycosyltransferase family 4 protein [Flavobacterium glaciei]RDI58375.1 glycosyltransferase involved in cell wall biosynthesis [Flavobacterium glaciei]TWI52160.1 glycosyltransferase involved in cell wall biosynthesis [Flavobacterium glaciei]
MKPSILIIADFPGWAYFEIQQFIKKNVSDDFDIYCDFLIYNTKVKSINPLKRIKSILDRKKYSRIRKDNTYDLVFDLAFYFEKQMKVNWVSKYKIKGIYTDGFPPSNSNFVGEPIAFINEFCFNTDALVCGSTQIKEFYSNLFPEVFYANCIIDDQLFKRKTFNKKPNFIIGWTGNPKRDFKGYYSHVVKAVEILKVKYPDIELKSRFSGPIETLPSFYEDVDLVLIASDADAGPAMFGEAALMGVPSVSTNIGWPSQVIQDGINGFIVEKDLDKMVEKIEILYNNRSLLEEMSSRIRTDFQKEFNKQEMIDRWKILFTSVLNIKK